MDPTHDRDTRAAAYRPLHPVQVPATAPPEATHQLDTWDGRSVSVAVHRVAYLHDLALIETLEPLPRVARLAAGDPGPGARVTAVGFPLGGPLTQTRGRSSTGSSG